MVQVFDGITAAVLSVMVPLVVADVAFEAATSIWRRASSEPRPASAASLSTVLAGYVSDRFGSSMAFTGWPALRAWAL